MIKIKKHIGEIFLLTRRVLLIREWLEWRAAVSSATDNQAMADAHSVVVIFRGRRGRGEVAQTQYAIGAVAYICTHRCSVL